MRYQNEMDINRTQLHLRTKIYPYQQKEFEKKQKIDLNYAIYVHFKKNI